MEEDRSMPRLSHANANGEAQMVDVADKPITDRLAEAEGSVSMSPATLDLVRRNLAEKGDVLGVARIAGIQAAKKTSELIPLCHALALDHIEVQFELDDRSACIRVRATARTRARTGVEMEALTAVSIAAVTIYDMLKAVDRGMSIGGLRVTFKSGGRSGTYRADRPPTPVDIP